MTAPDSLVHRWRVDDYRLLKALTVPRLQVELLEGELHELSDRGGALHGGPHRWTYDEYMLLVGSPEARQLAEGMILIDGDLVDVPVRPSVAETLADRIARPLTERLLRRYDHYHVRTLPYLMLDYQTAVRPDVAVTFDPPAVMGQKEWLLIVDVTDGETTLLNELRRDLYARHRVAEHWHVNLADRCVSVHRHPERDWRVRPAWRYAEHTVLRAGDELRPLAETEMRLPVSELLDVAS
jgi:hypothetical protein